MDSNGCVKVRLCCTCLHGDTKALHHLRSVCSNCMQSNNFACIWLPLANADELHHDSLLLPSACGHRVLHWLELCQVYIHAAVLDGGLLLCEAAAGDWRLREDCAWNVLMVRARFLPSEQCLCHSTSLHERHWRQVDAVGHITNGINGVHICLAILVDEDLSVLGVQLDASCLQTQVCTVWRSSCCKHNLINHQRHAALHCDEQATVRGLNLCWAFSSLYIDALLLKTICHVLLNIRVESS
mmetsp:Transcript_15263/g.34825  ORF Transcript_15263/g.34825 Transcript_15263/m.34825 type:complete len:241 (+) Transcript_15263:135-857(+)